MRWQELLGKNWVLKILSLAFALLLWFFVVGEEKAEVSMALPIEIVNIPADLVIANDIPPAVDVRLYGPRSMVRSIANQALSKVIDLKGATEGTVSVYITPESLPLPSGLRVIRIQPSTVEIVLDHLLRKQVPISPVITGRPAQDYEIRAVTVDPPFVTLSGPAQQLKPVLKVSTVPVDVAGARTTFTLETGLDLRGLHLTADKRSSVKVTVQIVSVQGTRRITHVPVHVEGDDRSVTWWPKAATVVLKGDVAGLRKLRPEDITLTVSTDGLSTGTHMLKPTVAVPKDFEVSEVSPEEIKVSIAKAGEADNTPSKK